MTYLQVSWLKYKKYDAYWDKKYKESNVPTAKNYHLLSFVLFLIVILFFVHTVSSELNLIYLTENTSYHIAIGELPNGDNKIFTLNNLIKHYSF